MTKEQQDQFHQLVSNQKNLTHEWADYWSVYSDYSTWQFWFILALLCVPLIAVYKYIDRTKIFQIAFFGFAMHVLFAYTEILGVRSGLWGYPYQLIPYLPSISLDASLIPVVSMLVYQWTLNRRKNFHLYAAVTALAFGFGVKPLLVAAGLFERYEWINYFLIFVAYFLIFEGAYLLTSLFKKMRDSVRDGQPKEPDHGHLIYASPKLPKGKKSKIT